MPSKSLELWGQPPASSYLFRVEGTVLRGQLKESYLHPSSALSYIRARQPDVLSRALEIEREYGDPIQNLAQFLGEVPGSQEDWDRLVDEPYP